MPCLIVGVSEKQWILLLKPRHALQNVECIARAGDVKQARFLFEKTLTYANHLGMFSEQIGAEGNQLGNFPQAFTHLGLISAAIFLNKILGNSAHT
jgi:GH15 family glucan-1,4-alpha-glucosidase